MPSHSAKSAPSTQPSMACGPPMAPMMSGMVMKGPTPIMSIMFSAVALVSESPRTICGALADSGCGFRWLTSVLKSLLDVVLDWGCALTCADEVYVQPHCARHSVRQLAEEGICVVDVDSFSQMREQEAA